MVMGAHTRFYNYGFTSRDKQELPDADSINEIASITKTFTGALAAQAVVEHRMKLDTDFRDYQTEAYPNLAWQGHPITLSSLATHRSGLPRNLPNTDDLFAHCDFERLAYQLIERESGYDQTRYLQELHTVHLSSLPGSKEVYSISG
jgi:D-alanyl-D-alanine-carboxypeptidase/D-alanyl-D-alanine-endopeptidase